MPVAATAIHKAPLLGPPRRRRLYRSLLSRMPLRTAAYVVAASIVNKEAGRSAAIE